MPTKSDRRKSRVFRRTAKETRMFTKREKHSKHTCALCEKALHGVPHGKKTSEVLKLSKSKRRSSGMLGGILCNQCKSMVITEAAKVDAGIKTIADTRIAIRPYIEQIQKQVN